MIGGGIYLNAIGSASREETTLGAIIEYIIRARRMVRR